MTNKAGEQPTITQAQYLAMRCDNIPTDCVNFGVVDTMLGKEICRVWEEDDCRMIADLLNAPPISDTTSLAAQDGLVEALRILAEEITDIEQGYQEDLKLYLALLYHLQDRMKALSAIKGDKS
jgi:hypothetical protein